ncbi:hypothetical protein ZWY2020_037613 [Hordeum vulgare]|nr:hypothetical protein ZWY2020_037613 [Hordeum vulgare]
MRATSVPRYSSDNGAEAVFLSDDDDNVEPEEDSLGDGGDSNSVVMHASTDYQRLLPRVLVDVNNIDMSTNLLGYDMPSPIIVAPTGSHKLANPEGDVATTRAAASCNTLMVLSFSSSCKIVEVASSCNVIRFYQLYSHGFKEIVLNADTPMLSRREADIRNKMVAPANANLEGLMPIDDLDTTDGSKLQKYARDMLDPSLSWKWLKSIIGLSIQLKGIVTAKDARKAVEAGRPTSLCPTTARGSWTMCPPPYPLSKR